MFTATRYIYYNNMLSEPIKVQTHLIIFARYNTRDDVNFVVILGLKVEADDEISIIISHKLLERYLYHSTSLSLTSYHIPGTYI